MAVTLIALFLGGSLWTSAQDAASAKDSATNTVSYYKDIRPILQAQCHGCHQPAKAKGGYVMTTFDKLLAGGESKEKAIVPSKPEESHLLQLITPENGQAEMPQKTDPLSATQIALITKWIAQGATDDTPSNAKTRYDAEHPPVYKSPPVVTSLDYSPDGKRLAVSGFHEVLVHKTDGSGLAARLVGLSERIESAQFSPDGKKLAVTGGLPARMGEVQIWDVEKSKLEMSVPVTFDTVYGASWSPDGALVAFGCADRTLRVIDAKTGKQVLYQGSHDDWVLGTVFSTNGEFVVSVGRDQTAKLNELKTQRFIDNITSITPGALRGGIHGVARHPLRDEVLLASSDGTPQIFRMVRQAVRVIGDNSNLIRKFPSMPGRIYGVDYRGDGKRIVAGSSLDGRGYVNIYSSDFDSALSKELIKIFEKVASSRSAEENKMVETYQTKDVKLVAQTSIDSGVFAVAYSPDGSQVAIAGADGVVRLLDGDTASTVRVFVPVPLPEGRSGDVIALTVEPEKIELERRIDYSQMVVKAWLASGDAVDVTREALIEPKSDLVEVSATGLARGKKNGTGEFRVRHGGKTATVPVKVNGQDVAFEPNFVRDVAPVISRLGCNAGTCHGALAGKNGFKLSLRGYDPLYDVRAFTDDLAARRVNFASPDDSLMLLKATAGVPHEGGQRMKPNSDYYQILRDWIAAGCQLDLEAPKVKSIALYPANPVVQAIGGGQQMRVIATYSDGWKRDVTAEAYIESGNTEVATAKDPGLITSVRRGEAPVLARFEGAYAATTLTVMGDRTGFVWKDQPANNTIDEFVAAKWKRMKILPSDLCSDAEFVRRIYLDLTGLPPTAEETRQFIEDKREAKVKRDALIERLVGSQSYVDFWANKWADLLQVNRKFLGKEGSVAFRDWIRSQVQTNRPYQEFVHDILTASGSNKENPAASYYKILRTPTEAMENTTHLFLATRFNCNKCHDHPFERWTQDQYYQMSAFFARVGLKDDPASGNNRIGGTAVEGSKALYEIVFDKDNGEVTHDRTGRVTPPQFPYAAKHEQKGKATRREELADWITSADNQYFARSYVNRLWGYLTGVGLIEPLDDIRAGNPPSNPELLNWLTTRFIESGFNAQALIKTICQSRTYQLSIATHRWNSDDHINYSHAKPRRLPAEVLYDAIYAAVGAKSKFPGVPEGTRAAALPDAGVNLADGFLNTLGRPARESACECERSNDIQLGSVMALVTGPTVENAISDPANAIKALVDKESSNSNVVEEIYLRFLSRPASGKEAETALKILGEIEPDHQKLLTELEAYKKELVPIQAKREERRDEDIRNAKSELASYEQEIAPREADLDKKQQEAVAKAEEELKTYEGTISDKLAAWEKESTNRTLWAALHPQKLSASNGATLGREQDLSVLATGNNGKGNYVFVADTTLQGITGVKLEALTDKRLPKNGPGRAGDGNFVLTEFEASWAPWANPEQDKLVTEWDFSKDAGGWSALSQCELTNADNALVVKSTGKDPNFTNKVTAEKGSLILEVKAKTDRPLDLQLFWANQAKPDYNEENVATLAVAKSHGAWQSHRFYFKSETDLTGLRLDPGSAEGEIQIDEIKLWHGEAAKPKKVALQNAVADFSQQGFDVKTAIDGKTPEQDNGWAVHPKLGVDHMATFEFKEPVGSGAGSILTFKLDQRYKDNEFSLGRYRISVTRSKLPLNFGVPEAVGSILEIAADQRSEEQKKTVADYFRSVDQELKKKQNQLAEAKKPRPIDPKLKGLKDKLARIEQPLPPDSKLKELERAVGLSSEQLKQQRLTAAQDLAWALINNPAFLFNR